jgi:hypothetical protein
MIDPLGKLLTEIRSNSVVAALTTRIRGGEPEPGDSVSKADGYNRFVVLVRLGNDRAKRAGMQTLRIAARCYGTSYQDAAALAGAVSDAVHNIGPRRNTAGVLIFRTYDDIGLGATADPDTGQPHEDLVIEVFASTVLAPIA